MTESQNELKPKIVMVEWPGRVEYFSDLKHATEYSAILAGAGINNSVTPLYTRATSPAERQIIKQKLPWDRGNSGWDNYSDFLTWLSAKMPDHEEWINDSPSLLMTVFEQAINGSTGAERQIEAIRAAMERCKNAPPYMAFDAVYDLRGDIEKILDEGKRAKTVTVRR